MISLAEARALVTANVRSVSAQQCALENCHGRVVREAITAPEDIPAFDRSAMDGYAVAANATGARLRVVGEISAGLAPGQTFGAGECLRIFTGAAVPHVAMHVIPQEWVSRTGDEILIEKSGSQTFIRRRGEDAKAGQPLLQSGTVLGPGDLSLLAQIGCTSVSVSRRVRVAHLVTGDELVPPSQVPAPGQIRDSNSILIASLLADAGAELLAQRRAGDDRLALRRYVEEFLAGGCDLLLLSGGASVGDYDFGPAVLEELGFTIHFRSIDLRPGKPLVFATRDDVTAFVIPGNPVSHFVTFHAVIALAIAQLSGAGAKWETIRAKLSEAVPSQRDSRPTLWPVRLRAEAGHLIADPLRWQSSGDLRGLVGANGLMQLTGASPQLETGALVECIPVALIRA